MSNSQLTPAGKAAATVHPGYAQTPASAEWWNAIAKAVLNEAADAACELLGTDSTKREMREAILALGQPPEPERVSDEELADLYGSVDENGSKLHHDLRLALQELRERREADRG